MATLEKRIEALEKASAVGVGNVHIVFCEPGEASDHAINHIGATDALTLFVRFRCVDTEVTHE